MTGTTFDKYGGFAAVSRIVMTFYDLVLDDDLVGHHFDDVDMPKLIDHQTKFISSLMGGPEAIQDGRLRLVHHKLDITDAEFDQIVVLLAEALESHGVAARDIGEVKQLVESKRPLVVRRAPA